MGMTSRFWAVAQADPMFKERQRLYGERRAKWAKARRKKSEAIKRGEKIKPTRALTKVYSQRILTPEEYLALHKND